MNAPNAPAATSKSVNEFDVFSDRGTLLAAGTIATFLPFTVWLLNWIKCGAFPPATSVSQYYFTGGHSVFVGGMCTVGVLLLTYQGWRSSPRLRERLLSRVAATCAFGVGLVPTELDGPSVRKFSDNGCNQLADSLDLMRLTGLPPLYEHALHFVCAITLILWLAYVASFKFTEKSGDPMETNAPGQKLWRNKIYRACAWAMGIGIFICLVHLAFALTSRGGHEDVLLFIGETLSLMAFGIAWLVKSRWLFGYKAQEYGLFRGA